MLHLKRRNFDSQILAECLVGTHVLTISRMAYFNSCGVLSKVAATASSETDGSGVP